MTAKPSYELLEQRVRELEEKVTAGQQIQKELRESETRFKTLFEKAPEAIVVIDAETVKFVNANIAASRLFEFTREELIGLGPLDISPPVQPNGRASKELVPEKIQELLSENPEPFEWVHKNASGKEFLCEIHHAKLTITGRKLYSGIVIDITERRKAETKIKQFQHIIESTNNPIGLVDRNFLYRYANESYSRALNKPIREIIGHSVPELLGQNFFETVMKNHYERCFTGENISYQAWFELPGWGRRYMDVRYYPFREPDGKVSAVVTNVHDITEIKQLEMELVDSEERFRAFMDNNPAVVYIKDENDRHIYGNPAAFTSVELKPEEFFGSTTRDLWPPQIAEKLIKLDRKVIDGDIPRITEEWEMTEKSGRKWRRDIKFPIKLGSGKKLLGGIAIDITEIKEAEQALLKSQEDFRRLAGKLLWAQESERRRLAREMHDDLSQRIAVLAIDIGKIERHYKDMKDPVVENLQSVKERLVKLSEDIHAISRQLHPAILDDLGLVDAVKSECSSFTHREGIAVHYQVETIPPMIAKDVAICFYRIVQEGLRNVAKHAKTKKVAVSLSGKDDSLYLTIKDQGKGFDHKQAESKLGLGLASMRERIRLIRGDISIESQPGQGTVINVQAPLLKR